MKKLGTLSSDVADAETVKRLAALVDREVKAIGPNAPMHEILRSVAEAAQREEIDLNQNIQLLPGLMNGRRMN